MNRKTQVVFLLLTASAVGGFLLVHKTKSSSKRELIFSLRSSNEAPRIISNGTNQASNELFAELLAASTALVSANDPNGRKDALHALNGAFAGKSTNEISQAIRTFLDSKTDAATGLGFKVGANGSLKDAPTLRTYLLDYLGQIDPAAAAAYAKAILNGSDSPDEWAVAMRNLAAGDASPEGRKLLEQKVDEMLRHEDWQQNPSTGYLEAFDTAVYLGGTNLVPDLSNLVRKKDNPAVAHAAYLAMDRLVINDPATMMTALESDPSLMDGRELTRADYFARADVRDPGQRQALEAYLLNPALSPSELQQFSGVFPNANYMVSANLLTPSSTSKPGDLVARDSESLKVVNDWIADPRFAKARPQLERLKGRLEEFVRQAAK